jgi:class 3 adenylate cyclase
MNCPRCTAPALAGQKFCGECGASLLPQNEPAPAPAGERRQLTVMFFDMVGSTAIGARLDPEDFREVVEAYHRCVADNVTRRGGFVARYMGDGVLSYFGYPVASEDDAERAVRASIAVVEAVPRLNTVAGPPSTLRARAGIATGMVIVGHLIGAGESLEKAVVGDAPNLASRLQSSPNRMRW